MRASLLLLALCIGVTAQAPQSPCADAELRRAMAESRAASAEARAESKALLQENLEREISRQKQLIDSASQSLAIEHQNSVKLAASYEEEQRKVTGLQSERETLAASVLSLSAERYNLQLKIERANRRLLCRVFHLGCIGER